MNSDTIDHIVEHNPVLTLELENEILSSSDAVEIKAERLWKSHLRWYISFLTKHYGTLLDEDEGLSYAFQAIVYAVERHDPLRGRVMALATLRLRSLIWRKLNSRERPTDKGNALSLDAPMGEAADWYSILPSTIPGSDSLVEQLDMRETVMALVPMLPERVRYVVELQLAGHTNVSIARKLGKNRATVSKRLQEGVSMIQELLSTSCVA